MGFSYFEKKDYRKSLEAAYRGAKYKSELLPRFYVLAGNALDNLGDSKKAVDVYKAGLKISPTTPLLHFNLGITYLRMSKPEEARKSFKTATALAPNYSSAHLRLGYVFYEGGYKTPALLAISRFLVLEPSSERSDVAYKIFQELLQGGVSQGKNPNDINISVNMSDKKDEGNFGAVDLVIGLTKAGDFLEKNKGKTKAQLAVGQLETYFAILAEQNTKENQSKFVWKYYVPYFNEMKQRGYVEPFYYYVSRRTKDEEVQKWLSENFRRVNEFLNWSKQYQWPKVEV
jgi:tetratricopeptide (TPR) repeat protein